MAVLNLPKGVVIQPLPFDIELKKFRVDYYSTGMPKLFASEIVVHDPETGESKAATVKVNEPFIYKGVAIYQSSFDDGGSKLQLHAIPVGSSPIQPFDVNGKVGESLDLKNSSGQTLTLELTGLRVINVENLNTSTPSSNTAVDTRKVDLMGSLSKHLGSGAKGDKDKNLHNVGPAVIYKLRDASGQAREFQNYMLPVQLEGRRVFLMGVRDTAGADFKYLRIPADGTNSMDDWKRLQSALHDEAMRRQAVKTYVQAAVGQGNVQLEQQLTISAQRTIDLFAGVESVRAGDKSSGGLQAISDFLQDRVPQEDQQRTSGVLIRILNGVMLQLLQDARVKDKLPALTLDERTENFMNQSIMALSDAFYYPEPFVLQLKSFDQVQASVFQVTRAPGQKIVYLGCLLLVLGVFAMLYIRERRLWIWLQPKADETTKVSIALSSTRQMMDNDQEFERIKQELRTRFSAPTLETP